jgi:Cu(I)/Ag(I) efflux system membrane protein CusA/SilA
MVIAAVIAFAARNRGLVLLLVAAAALAGARSLGRVPLDALPDLSDVQVVIFTDWPGRSPELVEDQVTYPISTRLLGAPSVRSVRGESYFGYSAVYVVFTEGVDLYWARSRVLELLGGVRELLPEGASPLLGPDATGVGWVFQYALVDRSGSLDPAALRTLQDFDVRLALQSVPGVAEVASVGGFVRQYEVAIDPSRLAAKAVTIGDVIRAVRGANDEAGGSSLELGGHEYVVRGRGYVESLEDLRRSPVRAGARGAPVFVGDVAEVSFAPAPRRGLADLDGRGEAVGGIVAMRSGENAVRVIDGVKARLAEIAPSWPPGVEAVPVYDRSDLVRGAVGTLRTTLAEELAIVAVVVLAFLLHARSALVPIVTIPIGVLLAFVPLERLGFTADVMSLGGLAVAIGAMVDASIILVENVHRRLHEWEGEGSPGAREDVVLRAMQEVGPSVFFALLVITVSFLPIFALDGASGRLFRPLAVTKTFAMAFAAILAITLTPALAAFMVRGRLPDEEAHPVGRRLASVYARAVRHTVRRPLLVVGVAALALASSIPVWLALGSEFMPPLDEGTLLYMPTAPPGVSATEIARVLQQMDRELAAVPEVARVFGKAGRAETATDMAPLSMIESVVTLRPRAEWRPGMTREALLAELDLRLRWPGFPNLFWMPIQTRLEMQSTGLRSELGVQVLGDDLAAIERTAIAIERTLAGVSGTRSAIAERIGGGLYLDVRVDREAAARLGLLARDVNEVVETAIGGTVVSTAVEGRRRVPIQVRYARDFRDSPDAIARARIALPGGGSVPLAQVASIGFAAGPPFVRSEAGRLVGFVLIDVADDRPAVEYVAAAKAAVAREVGLPPGVRLAWTGQYQHFERARARLVWLVPATLALVALLLYANTRSVFETALVLLAVPFSLIGAAWLLFALGYHLSVAVWVGLIALAGLDAQTGVVMLLYLRLAHRRRLASGRLRSRADLEEAIVEGAAGRIRPKLMTVVAMAAGLLPLLWSDGTGADVMKRIAAPMVGGLASSFALELLVYPALFALWRGREIGKAG